jgi:hypothetical protein
MAQIPTMNPVLFVPEAIVRDTLAFLQSAGNCNSEGVVLWLGRRTDAAVAVEESYVPIQDADVDYFRIPPGAIADLLSHLGATHRSVAAQVHSHPKEAFHSDADDRWAIVRHRGALSLVVPWFGHQTSVDTFVRDIAAFRLSSSNTWEEISPSDVHREVVIE